MFYPARVTIGKTSIRSSDHGNGIVFGQNITVNKAVNGKKNQGFGQQSADGVFLAMPAGVVWDGEQDDSRSVKNNNI
ncbi:MULTISPECIES: hypothetical protein [Bacillus]|uniref:Spore germination protein n=2 Tax=Bacillus infantis TaxID=324767 RepID=U5LBY8_9BACI|nr:MULTISPECIES: hypothetical protein [Bacillus]OXT16343.1 hypothetical protein B9K06_15775 [Bacillus sp. OG2]AGX04933.1 hypothetical protein N288_15165 [Bacillus infantis NRRL B-14911]EAR67974.1 hypothetical protein B14911_24985 [Bacillus sp. NRRL B-14911]MCA1035333.1 hypothetical protein [Bacillus infantis]MCK6207443.1 hypothetical protein [Bacillus infantis]